MAGEMQPTLLIDGLTTNGHSPAGLAGELTATIARRVVGIYRATRGRGPTKARASFRKDLVVVVLEDVATPTERSLMRSGREAEALAVRRSVHAVMRRTLGETVSALTGTRVMAVLSDSSCDPDIAVEVFVLDRDVDPR